MSRLNFTIKKLISTLTCKRYGNGFELFRLNSYLVDLVVKDLVEKESKLENIKNKVWWRFYTQDIIEHTNNVKDLEKDIDEIKEDLQHLCGKVEREMKKAGRIGLAFEVEY